MNRYQHTHKVSADVRDCPACQATHSLTDALAAERALSDALAEALRDIVGDDGEMSVDTVRMGRVRLQNYAAARGALGGDTLAEVRR